MIKETNKDIPESGANPGPVTDAGSAIPGRQFELIRFDKKVNAYIGVCLFLYLFFVIFKWHNSSIPFWSVLMNDGLGENRGVVEGKPLAIRSDEWMIVSSFILAQEKDHFPVSNEALGYGKTPLIMGLPTKDIVSKVKPALWGYYILDKERGFSWQWNFKIFPFLIASFLFLMLFTKNNFTVSLFGSVWLFLSSAIQWWSINTEIFTYGFFSIISLIYIIYTGRTKLIILNGLVFLLASYSFITILYPAYQVPFGYFLLALLLAYLISRRDLKAVLNKKLVKISVFVVSSTLLLVLLYLFYKESVETIQVVANTVYPGQRIATGGDFSFISLFRDNYSWFLNETYFPPKWGNICELASFLMLSPVATGLLIYSYFKTKKLDIFFIPLLVFQVIIYIWLLWGFPEFFAKLTLFATSPAPRTAFIFGFANIVFTLLYLGKIKTTFDIEGRWQNKVIIFAGIFVMGFGINYLLNKQSDRFFSIGQIFNATIPFSALSWLIIYFDKRKIFQSFFFGGCFFFVASNLFINPLNKGLAPYFENKIYTAVSEIEEKDPDAGWVVFGHPAASNFLKAAGIKCFNGVQFAPPLQKLHVLDSSGKNNNTYDRYANIVFSSMKSDKDSINFVLNQPDLYTIQMDPCSPRLKQIGIKYLMFSYKPPDEEVKCMMFVKEVYGFFIYKRSDL